MRTVLLAGCLALTSLGACTVDPGVRPPDSAHSRTGAFLLMVSYYGAQRAEHVERLLDAHHVAPDRQTRDELLELARAYRSRSEQTGGVRRRAEVTREEETAELARWLGRRFGAWLDRQRVGSGADLQEVLASTVLAEQLTMMGSARTEEDAVRSQRLLSLAFEAGLEESMEVVPGSLRHQAGE
ncbi:MAG: hypothetical protein DWQ36_25780 [Acidobacteria bacterium]|nr:MAG: hypothetical protein DWQ30_17605 [Acidobacteriota bacterium]REJ99423.1 MAG: hypothetical protein DWQ36_25780 [Acidobacteriota bacterium]